MGFGPEVRGAARGFNRRACLDVALEFCPGDLSSRAVLLRV